ncbi:TolC family protein, partial [uncultured Enterobacter sp.]|uniref:TolC family protein n=1 Tax=uncultured Enterobacter sp. TaxID=238202 RepID=UPI0025D708BC
MTCSKRSMRPALLLRAVIFGALFQSVPSYLTAAQNEIQLFSAPGDAKPHASSVSEQSGLSGAELNSWNQAGTEYKEWPKARASVASAGASTGSHRFNNNAASSSEQAIRQLILNTVRQANSTNPRLLRARADALSAEESVDEARGQRWPQVDVSANSPAAQFGGGARSDLSDKPAFNVNVTTTLYDFGRTRHTIESREHSALAARGGEVAEQENAAWEISSLLTELSKQRHIIRVSQQYVKRMTELTTMLQGITQADAGRRSEYTQARGQLLKAQTALEAAESRTKDIEINLSRYLGNAAIVLPEGDTWGLQLPDTPRLLQLLESHPLLKQARASVAAALSEAEATRAAGMPSVNWSVSKSTAED